MSGDNGGWREYKRLIVSEVSRHDGWLRSLETRVGDVRTELRVLQAKAAMWGAGAGLVAAGLVALALKALGG